MASLAGGCGGAASTDTGNPPVVLGQGLRLTATETGVVISGDAGAVPAGARVDVVNTATGETATTTAEADGSFALEVDGAVTDEYRVYAANGSESWRTRLTSAGPAAAETGLAGRVFLLQSADGYTPVPGTVIRLSFEGGEMQFSAGCNSHSGPYAVCEDGTLCLAALASTEIGCEPPLHEQDEWLAGFLESSPAMTQSGAALTLTQGGATLEFLDREVADADRSLIDRTWTIDTFIEDGGASNSPTVPSPTLQFGADGRLTIFTTCVTGGGSYSRSGQTLTFVGVSYPEEACEGSVFVHDRIVPVMTEGEVTFEIEAARLTITRGTLGLSATTE
jgi:heat shock protein HslJ